MDDRATVRLERLVGERTRELNKLAQAVEQSPLSVVITDVDGTIEHVNPTFTRVTGYQPDEAIGKNPRMLKSGETSADKYADLWATILKGRVWRGELQNRRKNGDLYWAAISIAPVADETDTVTHFIAMTEDITRDKQTRAEVKASMERFRVLFEQSYDAHLIFSGEGVIDCNQAAVDMVRAKDKDDLLGRQPSVFSAEFQPDGRRSAEKFSEIDAFARAHGWHRFDWIARRLDGEEFPVEVTLTPVTLSGTPAMLVGWHDLTERKAVEAALEKAREEADAANQAKSAFLANMSHELRTPMNAILGYSEMLTEEAEDVGQDDFIPDLKKINHAGNHLLSLINDVLDLSKIESGKMEAFTEVFDVGALIDQIAGTAQPLMVKNNNHFRIERGDNLGNANQDITKLRQSLLNLLSNAAKFTHEGTITLQAERQSQADGDWLTFAVSDTGIGIAADKLGHVFEEFSQADESTTRDFGGTGLGLAISRRFCQMLGGKLSVSSELGAGSTFTIRLPATLPGAEVPQEDSTQPASSVAQTSAEGPQAKHGNTLLVIDDDAEACEIIRRFLEKDGFDVVTAVSGEEGLRLAHQLQPAAITLDVMMPDMDGWSVLRALKVDPVLHTIPVVMLTMVDDKTRGYSLGATDYITKPVDRERLHTALEPYYTGGEHSSVLVVEDDPATRDILVRTLKDADWQVSEAGNGREALERLAEEKPQMILLDLMMPVMDGFDFLLEMRANADWQNIPVIVLTAKDLTEEDRRVLSGRVEQIVEKGASSHQQVVKLVRQVVEQAPATGKSAAPAQ